MTAGTKRLAYARMRSQWQRVLTALALLSCLLGCQQLEPRWLINRLPGEYPAVTYYFPTDERLIALTIDDGPDPQATPALLEVLAEHNAKATFFLVSDEMEKHPALVKAIIAAGHELGNHMTEDEPSVRLAPDEFVAKLDRAAEVISDFLPDDEPTEVLWFRPGHARYNAHMRDELAARGYRIALASMIPLDARLRAPRIMASYIKRSIKPGSVVVLHSVGDRGLRAARSLALLLPALARRDYQVGTLSDVAGASFGSGQPADHEGERHQH